MAQTINNAGNNTVGASNTGQTNTFTVTNSSDTASSAALINVTVGGTSAADAFTTYTVAGTTNWSQGVDNSDSDAFVIAASTALGTTNVMRAQTTGEINFPLQSSFLAFLGSAVLNATGDSTNFTLGSGTALTEIFDQNNDFNTNGTFTAPVTGRYHFCGTISVTGGTVITAGQINLVTSNRNYFGFRDLVTLTTYDAPLNVIADMDAADTCTLHMITVDSGGKVDDINGDGTSIVTWFSGYLEC